MKYQLELSPKNPNRFAFTDKKETYMEFHTQDSGKTDGVVCGSDTLLSDFYLVYFDSGNRKYRVISRYESIKTVLNFDSFEVQFTKDISICCSLLSQGIYFQSSVSSDCCIDNCFLVVSVSSDIEECLLSKGNNKLMFLKGVRGVAIPMSDIPVCFSSKVYLQQEEAKKAFSEHKNQLMDQLSTFSFETENQSYSKALYWAIKSGEELVTGKDSLGIWAGLPWFRDNWGRDTFIALSGILLVSGQFEIAKKVIQGFAEYQDRNPTSPYYGRIPNRYVNKDDVIYNTADGTLWFIRAVYEYAQYTGDKAFLEEMWPVICLAIETNRNNTDKYNFLTHGDADTWMDARIEGKEPWSPRGNRGNDIQALWYTALHCGSYIAMILGHEEESVLWKNTAYMLRLYFLEFFWNGSELADCLLADGTPDFRCRPNQFMCLWVPQLLEPLGIEPFVPKSIGEKIINKGFSQLVMPYGVLSLSQKDPYFHPYHDMCRKYHKDAAYHNGTIWGWNAGFTISCLCNHGFIQEAWSLSKNLTNQILYTDCAGSMSENINPFTNKKGEIQCSGTWSQAWSVSEFARNCFQDYMGIQPLMLESTIYVNPHIPVEFGEGKSIFLFGTETVTLKWKVTGECTISSSDFIQFKFGENLSQPYGRNGIHHFCIKNNDQQNIKLSFVKQEKKKKFVTTRKRNWLKKQILKKGFNPGHTGSYSTVR